MPRKHREASNVRTVNFVGGPHDGEQRVYPSALPIEPDYWVIGAPERIAHYEAGGSTDTEPHYVLERTGEALAYVWRRYGEDQRDL